MIKIAFFDVDGTLLQLGSKEPSPKTVQALQKLRANGVLLCMATGRGYLSVPHFESVDFDIWLTFNGSYVRSKDTVLFKNPLDVDDKYRILQNLKQMHRAAAISNEHFIVTNGTDPDLAQYFSFGSEKLMVSDRFDALCEEEIYQIMCLQQRRIRADLTGDPRHTDHRMVGQGSGHYSTLLWQRKRRESHLGALRLFKGRSHCFWRWSKRY